MGIGPGRANLKAMDNGRLSEIDLAASKGHADCEALIRCAIERQSLMAAAEKTDQIQRAKRL